VRIRRLMMPASACLMVVGLSVTVRQSSVSASRSPGAILDSTDEAIGNARSKMLAALSAPPVRHAISDGFVSPSSAVPVELGSGALSVSFAGPTLAYQGSTDDLSLYGGPADGFSLGVRPTDGPAGGVQELIAIPDAAAPHTYAFNMGGAHGTRLTATRSGGIEVHDGASDQLIGFVSPPWANDADGHTVATRYELRGSTIVQTVDFNERTAFPVVADPHVKFYWWGIVVSLSAQEVMNLIWLGIDADICAAFDPGIFTGIACSVAVGFATNWLSDNGIIDQTPGCGIVIILSPVTLGRRSIHLTGSCPANSPLPL
jgi:hypothetical protein